jgi:hypothetical protein
VWGIGATILAGGYVFSTFTLHLHLSLHCLPVLLLKFCVIPVFSHAPAVSPLFYALQLKPCKKRGILLLNIQA